ncbi:MAG: DMT family transporter [Nitrososphaerales archaeon]
MEQGTDTLHSEVAGVASAREATPASRLDGLRARRQLLADGALLLVTLIWGATFVMVKDAVTGFPVFSFMAFRFTLAALALAPFSAWQGHRSSRSAPASRQIGGLPILVPSILVGTALFAGYAFQTFGLRLTTPAKAGFITGLSVAIVPVASALLLRQSPPRNAWIGVCLATLGLALLALTADLSIQPGDLLVLCCALAYAAHILLLGHFAPRYNPILLTFGQVTAVAVFSGLAALIFEQRAPVTGQVLFAAAFTGVLATAVAFLIQTVAQRFTTSTHTALIFAAEPVFAGLFSLLLIGEVLGPRQLLGCALILGGMLVAELKGKDGHG